MNVGFNFVVAAGRNSGAKEYLVNLLRELIAAEGPERYTVYFAREEQERVIQAVAGASPNVRCIRTPIPMFPTAERVVRGEFYWRRQLQSDRIDVFHHTYFPLPRGVERVSRVVLTLYDLIQRGMPEAYTAPRRWFTNLVQPSALRRAHRIAVISEHVRDEVAAFHPEIELRKLRVIPCAAGSEYLVRGRRDPEPGLTALVRERYRLPPRYILGVGHLEPRKNWPRLIQAYARLYREHGADVPGLVIVGGENWKFAPIYEAAEREGIRDRISFTGFVLEEHMSEVYANASVFVYPSLYEGFGIPVLEAMACGVPVLTSNVTALPEVAGGAACLVDPYSVDAIHAGLRRVLTDEAFREDLATRGFANVERYRWTRSGEALRDVYRELVPVPRLGSSALSERTTGDTT